MSNYFTDNKDLQFTLDNLDLEEVVRHRENDYQQAKDFDYAPEDYADAKDSFKRVLELVGEIACERIAPRARIVDEEGPHFENNKVTYHPLTVKNLEELQQAKATVTKGYNGESDLYELAGDIVLYATELQHEMDARVKSTRK